MMSKCVLVDMDGTLSNATYRLLYVTEKPKNYKKFYDLMGEDEVYESMKSVVNKLHDDFFIVIFTARPEKYLSHTYEWLRDNGIKFNLILMRKNNDFRKDFETKKEMLDNLREMYKFEVVLAFDDRPLVCKMFRENGVPAILVNHDTEIAPD